MDVLTQTTWLQHWDITFESGVRPAKGIGCRIIPPDQRTCARDTKLLKEVMLPLLLSKQRRSFLLEVDSSEEATIGKISSELSWRLSYQRCSSVTLRLINQNLRRIIHTMERIIIDSNESVTRSKNAQNDLNL
uniref:Uncharacterized protein n=1 Tax=Vespula pensylvanica TaxID=30213 RepID=A0A834NS96_VESPE|nr:hypothetical protein H0235_011567 [Vespula pensylvanica]